MAVTVTPFDQLATLILTPNGININTLRVELMNVSATVTRGNTSKEQVDGGSKATVTMTIATPGVITDTAHGFSAGQAVAFITTGTMPTGITAGTFYYVVSPTTNAYSVSATVGGSAIATSGTQSGVHTRYSSGTNEVYGNGWIPGGPTLTSVVVNAANLDAGASSNDALITAANPSVTAVGGSLPPSAAYNALVWDATSFKPLFHVSFGQAQQAGVTTNFAFLIDAIGGLLNIKAT
jgi:hypothetical protein